MPTKICTRCGRSFQGSISETQCSACRNQPPAYGPKLLNNSDMQRREAVRNFVRDHQGMSDREVAENMGVSKKFLRGMMRDGIFSNQNGNRYQGNRPCAKCGKTINTGLYCRECLVKLRDTTKAIGERRDNLKRNQIEAKLSTQRENLVLVIDKDEMNANTIKFVLEKELPDFRVTVTDNLIMAMNALHGLAVKLVILDDTSQSDFDGFKIFESIRADPMVKNTPIVMTSGQPQKTNLARALSLGALDYITKPFNPKDLVGRVNRALAAKVVNFAQRKIFKILVIDDQPLDIRREKTILENRIPCEVTTAQSGVEGLYILGEKYVDLLLVSLDMPFMGGMEILAFIRRDERLRKLSVIMMTDTDDIGSEAGSSVKGYIQKPEFTMEGLLLIEKVLRNPR